MQFLPQVDSRCFFAQISFLTPSFPFINHSSLVASNFATGSPVVKLQPEDCIQPGLVSW